METRTFHTWSASLLPSRLQKEMELASPAAEAGGVGFWTPSRCAGAARAEKKEDVRFSAGSLALDPAAPRPHSLQEATRRVKRETPSPEVGYIF